MEKATNYKEILRKGDYTRIAGMIDGVPYKPRTVEAQLKGDRTLQENVKIAADKYIETIYPNFKENENT